MNENTFLLAVLTVCIILLSFIGFGFYLSINYNYRWNLACAQANGQIMENTSSSPVCVKSPVQLINIAVKPW